MLLAAPAVAPPDASTSATLAKAVTAAAIDAVPKVFLETGCWAMARLRFARASSVAVAGVRWATSAAAVIQRAARAVWRSIFTALRAALVWYLFKNSHGV